MPAFDQNRPTVRAKGFQKPASHPHVAEKPADKIAEKGLEKAPRAPAPPPKLVDFAPPAAVASSPVPEAPAEQPYGDPLDDSPANFIESDPFLPPDEIEEAVPSTHFGPPAQPETSAYPSDQDPTRVSRRQWWKHNLYVRSGREAADNPQ